MTNQAPAHVVAVTQPGMASVFLPTTPNPTSGWLTFVPEDQLIDMHMSVDDAFKLIISGGVLDTAPQLDKSKR